MSFLAVIYILHFYISLWIFRASLVAQLVKNLPAMQETLVWFLGQEGIGYPTPVLMGFPGGSDGKKSDLLQETHDGFVWVLIFFQIWEYVDKYFSKFSTQNQLAYKMSQSSYENLQNRNNLEYKSIEIMY